MARKTDAMIAIGRRPDTRGPRNGRAGARTALILCSMLGLFSCGQGESPSPASSPAPSASTPVAPVSRGAAGTGDAEKGRQVYLGHCVTCHHRDPAKDGPLGPAVKGSSAELVAARVLQGAYPPGYVPKRPSRVMPARPDLSASVPDLAAYLR